MAITRGNSARTASPTPSENSDMYYEDSNNRYASLSPVPSQTADAFGWDSDATLTPGAHQDDTPTPQPAHVSSPASVPRAKASKASKGKSKAKAAPIAAEEHTSDNDDPFLAAATVHAVTASLGLPTPMDHATGGASSSRHLAASAGSPSKRRCSNTAGEAGPTPYAATPVTPAVAAAPVATPATAPTVPVATPVTAPSAPPAPAPAAAVVPAPTATIMTTPTAAIVPAPVTLVAAPAPTIVTAPAPMHAPAPRRRARLLLPPLPLRRPLPPPLPLLWWLHPPPLLPCLPSNGFPELVYSPELLLLGVPPDLIAMYKAVAHPKFFLVVSGGNGAVMKTHGLIREAIGNFINIDPTSFTLGTPPTAANGTSPALWLVTDLPGYLAQAILDTRILCSSKITLFALPYDMPVISFIGVFAGFTLPNTDDGAVAARDLIRTAIAANGEISQFMQTHQDAFGPLVSAGQAWEAFLTSVEVHGIVLIVNNTNTVAWRLHVAPPTDDHAAWGQLRHLFGQLQVMTARYGTARLQWAFRCRICPSIDHPTPLCPLPSLPGWLGATHITIATLEDASRAAAAKAQEQMRLNAPAGASGSNNRSGQGRNQGTFDSKPRRDGKGKKGGGIQGEGEAP
ncbi:hypothetical protein MVEN_00490200 [Mycena venus]|uniref:Uncharacterized protein n=1 Tax=Mycena venus TaxID=2733690 RepID=A0A8H7DBM4_9AGAR|nr:hypothetical protein MVEN_00490200 [Mycena venus]